MSAHMNPLHHVVLSRFLSSQPVAWTNVLNVCGLQKYSTQLQYESSPDPRPGPSADIDKLVIITTEHYTYIYMSSTFTVTQWLWHFGTYDFTDFPFPRDRSEDQILAKSPSFTLWILNCTRLIYTELIVTFSSPHFMTNLLCVLYRTRHTAKNSFVSSFSYCFC